jgi:hypothetical protein
LCTGGTTSVTYTVSDLCNPSTVTKTFEVVAPQSVNITNPGNKTSGVYLTQAAVNAEFATWLSGFAVNGGCNPQGSYGTPVAPNLCGGVVTVNYHVTDLCTNTSVSSTFTVPANVAPVINLVTANSIDPMAIGTITTMNISFTDLNATKVTVTWDDGMEDIIQNLTTSTISIPHKYVNPGVYTVSVAVTDVCGAITSFDYKYVVIFDPNGGFVTGGGWINSPVGASIAYPTATGKANFGFVAKYKKGSTIPDGNTEFQFKNGNLNFNSTSYQDMRLVISGYKANYKGLGTINGTGNYGFLVTAVDGNISGGGGTDKFRIKIWDKNNGNTVVYDNEMSKDENDLPTTPLGGGSIVIHEVKKGAASKVEIVKDISEPSLFNVIAYPNPSNQYFNIEMKGGSTEKVDVMVYDVLGRTIKHIESSDGQFIRFGDELPTGVYIAVISQGMNQKTVRLIKE